MSWDFPSILRLDFLYRIMFSLSVKFLTKSSCFAFFFLISAFHLTSQALFTPELHPPVSLFSVLTGLPAFLSKSWSYRQVLPQLASDCLFNASKICSYRSCFLLILGIYTLSFPSKFEENVMSFMDLVKVSHFYIISYLLSFDLYYLRPILVP